MEYIYYSQKLKPLANSVSARGLAEREGFEPSVPFCGYTRFPVVRLRPAQPSLRVHCPLRLVGARYLTVRFCGAIIKHAAQTRFTILQEKRGAVNKGRNFPIRRDLCFVLLTLWVCCGYIAMIKRLPRPALPGSQ